MKMNSIPVPIAKKQIRMPSNSPRILVNTRMSSLSLSLEEKKVPSSTELQKEIKQIKQLFGRSYHEHRRKFVSLSVCLTPSAQIEVNVEFMFWASVRSKYVGSDGVFYRVRQSMLYVTRATTSDCHLRVGPFSHQEMLDDARKRIY